MLPGPNQFVKFCHCPKLPSAAYLSCELSQRSRVPFRYAARHVCRWIFPLDVLWIVPVFNNTNSDR